MEISRLITQVGRQVSQQCRRRCPRHPRELHSSAADLAISHSSIHPGPPPAPPIAFEPYTGPENASVRKRKLAEAMREGRIVRVDPSKPSQALRRRFWQEAYVKETPGLQVMLDTRPVRIASRNILTLPHSKHHLAAAIALEWDLLVSSQQALKHHYIPLTSLVSRAIDIQTADNNSDTSLRQDLTKSLLKYLSTDALLLWAPETHQSTSSNRESVRSRQESYFRHVVGYLSTVVWPGVEIKPDTGGHLVVPVSQDPMTENVISGWVYGLPAYELAGLERAVLASKSLVLGARLVVEWSQHFAGLRGQQNSGNRFGVEEAAKACSVEVTHQTEVWGEVDDTHDVDKEDLRRQLGSVVLLVG